METVILVLPLLGVLVGIGLVVMILMGLTKKHVWLRVVSMILALSLCCLDLFLWRQNPGSIYWIGAICWGFFAVLDYLQLPDNWQIH